MKERLKWVLRTAQRQRTIIHFRAPADTVAASLSAHLQTDFPSPKGELVVAGRMVGSDPTLIRLRIFPDGARVGRLSGGTQANWMKPSVVGKLFDQDDGSELNYRLVANGIPFVLGCAVLAVVALVVAVVMVATGHDWPSLIALIVAAWLGVGMAQLVGQADQGIREERLIYEWLLMILGPVP